MSRSRDEECKYRAVKCLMLISMEPNNVDVLLSHGVLEALYDSAQNSDTQTAKASWEGMKRLAADPEKMLQNARTTNQSAPEEYDDPEFVVQNRSGQYKMVRLPCLLQGDARVYYEVRLATEDSMQFGFSSASFVPLAGGKIGDTVASIGEIGRAHV